ncbi:peptide transporter family 1-like [Ruditapes philippinarum]|uniref:peptide transporter family 1-like n=1 Tax=Ruditapes philippinarum TaxID=129788 RepID=UPI00295B20C6|nr:peptide transporter family 1-like [Ruditapes philippinarum]
MDAGYGSVKPDGFNHLQADSETDLIADQKTKVRAKQDYPYSVFFILSNEFCERFSYYGMRAVLVLYLTRWLSFEENQATSIFHAFSMMCYAMPLLGAVIADGYLGRYRTILYLSCVYLVGNLVLSLTALPPAEWYGPAVGLFLIAIGTGGIKASVAPFGADQFLPGQEKWQNSFFSAFYFMINLGSMLSIIITPILRADVQCFGNDCYILAFGVPAVLMFLSVALFFLGRHQYQKVPPAGNIVGKTFKCIFYGLKERIKNSKYEEPREHWLYYADKKYDNAFIGDVRQLLKVLTMFLPLPLFWALSDQQGSRWTLQAEHMDGDIGIFGTVKPDQMQALNPLLILALIPLFDKVVYPFLDLCKVSNRPLQRMVVGLYITAGAFVCAGLVQLKIDMAEDTNLTDGQTGFLFLNTLPCSVDIKSSLYEDKISGLSMSRFLMADSGIYKMSAKSHCNGQNYTFEQIFESKDSEAYRMILYLNDGKMKMGQFPDEREKPKHGNAALSIFCTDKLADSLTIVSMGTDTSASTDIGTHINVKPFTVTNFIEMEPLSHTTAKFTLKMGGVYTALVYGNGSKSGVHLYVDVTENTVSMAWMIPQYVLVTLGEVLFSISGLSFAYSQAPMSLKSVVQAVWLLTVSFGDLMVIIVANIHSIPSQMYEFFLFAVLMFLDTFIFMIMSMFYKYKANSLDYAELGEESEETNSSKRHGDEEFPLKSFTTSAPRHSISISSQN